MTGIEVLRRVRDTAPDAKLLLLTAYADTDVAIEAINDIGLDHYMLKPWDPPEERLYPVVDDLLGDWQRDHPDPGSQLRVVGHRWSDRSHEVKGFLARAHVPYRWLDVEQEAEARELVDLAGAGPSELPLVLVPEGDTLRAPDSAGLAEALGLHTRADQTLYDLCVVGAGPAGLAAAVYAASEGLRTIVVERDTPGGQAGQSSAIENYLGFPKGLSGADLTQRAVAQARRFGAEMVLTRDVVGLERREPVSAVRLADGSEVEARAVVLATGVSYRRLEAPGLDDLGFRGVYYGASTHEAVQCRGEEVHVVGAANSAGQAALNFARYAERVFLLVRGDSLTRAMSTYLVDRITTHPKIEVRVCTQVVGARGAERLEALTLADGAKGQVEEVPATSLFVFIGAMPRTGWLGDAVVRDEKGFLLTGPEMFDAGAVTRWPLARSPYALETSVPGVFAAGDVRLGSMKRVASAVGEGAMAVHLVHRYLAST
jgi:thioredoxin reductase (NADPH)